MTHQRNAHAATPAALITEDNVTIEQMAKAAEKILDLHEAHKLTDDDLVAWKDPLLMVSSFRLHLQLMSIVQQLVRDLDDLREQQQLLMHLLAEHGVLPAVDHEEHLRMIAADLH